MKSIRLIVSVIFIALALIILSIQLLAKDATSTAKDTKSTAKDTKSTTLSGTNTGTHALDVNLDWTDLQRTLDADRDGYITQEEWNRAFIDHDANGDKRLSIEDLRSFFRRDVSDTTPDTGRQAAFDRLDKNRNGVIERTEWPGKEKAFRHMDANHDGVIGREEFLATSVRWWNDVYENLDLDGNGAITRSEWLDSEDAFDRLDKDHNGIITKSEFYNPR
jgi:Ca2+-binding EF-hand superfamily protein